MANEGLFSEISFAIADEVNESYQIKIGKKMMRRARHLKFRSVFEQNYVMSYHHIAHQT